MVHSINTPPQQKRQGKTAVPGASAELRTILSELAGHGLGVRLHQRGAQLTTAGITARVALGSLAASCVRGDQPLAGHRPAPDRGLSVVYAALRAGIPVTVTIIDPAGRASDDSLAAFRQKFREFLDTAAVDRRLLGLCLSGSELPSAEFRIGIRPELGNGPRFVMLHDAAGQARSTALWQLLQAEEQGLPRFWPVFPAGVRSQCPLLSGESSSGVLPGTGLSVPLGSAWLPIELKLDAFADRRGHIDGNRLDNALDASVDLGDRLLDHLTWFDDRQRTDASANRRLAICLLGLGDLVHRQGDSPANFQCLRRLDGLIAAIRARLWQRSKRLAELRGPLPALAARSPRGAWRDASHQLDWRRRWQAAVTTVQVRHRNLLAMSPYSILPRGSPASPESGDLLPLLGHADALCFARPPSLQHWDASDFRGFHRRVEAQVERHNAASFIAAGV